MRVRLATPADAPRLVEIRAEGFATYRSFTPTGWEPPTEAADKPGAFAMVLADPDYRAAVAEDDAYIFGFAGYLPAATSRAPVEDDELAHLQNLFVTEAAWGSPAARMLHAWALNDARDRGFTSMRLFCAAGQARARRFYEREGWAVSGTEQEETPLGIPVVEYRRGLLAER